MDKLKKNIGLINKQDLMDILDCKSDKALRLFKFMFQCGDAVKIGNSYYCTQEKLEKFLSDMEGKAIAI